MLKLALGSITSLLLAISASAQVETWQIDPAHTASQFAVRHMGLSTVRGAFTKTSGTVQYDRQSDPVSIKVNEIYAFPKNSELPSVKRIRGILKERA